MGGGFWYSVLWFAFKLVSLNHWEQLDEVLNARKIVVICFQISIFEPLGTIVGRKRRVSRMLWFAFKLVSLNHWEQLCGKYKQTANVVICFQISIFEPLGTIFKCKRWKVFWLWFAFKLVSLNHWEQYVREWLCRATVVICFQISIFEPLGTIDGAVSA